MALITHVCCDWLHKNEANIARMAFDSTEDLDEGDWKLLELLQGAARRSCADRGGGVSRRPPAVGERVRRLEQLGVITGYHGEVDGAKLGFPMQAVVGIIAGARLSEQLVPQ